MFFRTFFILLILSFLFVSCTGLREHIKQRQLETRGDPKSIRDYRKEKDEKRLVDTLNRSENTAASARAYSKYANKWGVDLAGNEDKNLLSEIDAWLGVKYLYGGGTKNGTDCSGMIKSIYKKVYDLSLSRSASDMQKDVKFIDLKKGKLGDILFFKVNGANVSHVGLYLGNNKFIHATTSKGVIISSLEENYYAKRFFKCGSVVRK